MHQEVAKLRIEVHEDNEDSPVLPVHLARKVIPVTTACLDLLDHQVRMVTEVTLALLAPQALQALLALLARMLQAPTGSTAYDTKRSSKHLNSLPSMEWKRRTEPGPRKVTHTSITGNNQLPWKTWDG